MPDTDAKLSFHIKSLDKFYIGGEWVKPSSTDTFDVISPNTEQVIATVAMAREADMDRAVAAARKAFDHGPWPRMSHAERADLMRKFAAEIRKRASELGHLWTEQMGIIYAIGQYSAEGAAATYEYYAGLAATYPFEEDHTKPGATDTTLLVREPVGVVAAIAPWNGPLALMTNKTAPALLAGCTIIMKPAPETPLDAYILAECAEAVGIPAGVLNLVNAGREVSEYLVRRPGVDKVSFTGSTVAGKRIASACGERIARCTLELGGKSAAIILDDYSAADAAAALAPALSMMTGQVCAALTRVIVPHKRHNEFADAFASQFQAITVGNSYEPTTQMGPLSIERQRDRVEGYIAKGKAEGAKLVTGGNRPKHLNRGYFIEPTLFANVETSMTIAQEEIFGPVLSMISYKDDQDALRIANDSAFGLNGAVFTNDVDKAYHMAREIRSGTVGHNGMKLDFGVAFGGFKQSGIGREGGKEGLLPYLETKTVILAGRPSHLN